MMMVYLEMMSRQITPKDFKYSVHAAVNITIINKKKL